MVGEGGRVAADDKKKHPKESTEEVCDRVETREALKAYMRLASSKLGESSRASIFSIASKLGVHPDDMGGFLRERISLTPLQRASMRLILAMETEKLVRGPV